MERAARAAAVICVSQYTAQEAVAFLGIEDPVVVPTASPTASSTPHRSGRSPGGSGRLAAYVLASGGASERKNLAALAVAWPQVHRARPDLTLVHDRTAAPAPDRAVPHASPRPARGHGRDDVMPGLIAAPPPWSYRLGRRVSASRPGGDGRPDARRGCRHQLLSRGRRRRRAARGADASRHRRGARARPLGRRRSHGDGRARRVRARDFTWQRSAEGHAAARRRVAAYS